MSRTEHRCPYHAERILPAHYTTDAKWFCGECGWLCDMCKRDYELAGRALQGLLANPGDADAKEVARLATLHADALIEQLAGGKEDDSE